MSCGLQGTEAINFRAERSVGERFQGDGADDGIRTCDLLFTKQLLYP